MSKSSFVTADIADVLHDVVVQSYYQGESDGEVASGASSRAGGELEGAGAAGVVADRAGGPGAARPDGGSRGTDSRLGSQLANFYRVLQFTDIERDKWGDAIGATPQELEKLIARAYEEGRLWKNPRTGLPHRAVTTRLGRAVAQDSLEDPPFARPWPAQWIRFTGRAHTARYVSK